MNEQLSGHCEACSLFFSVCVRDLILQTESPVDCMQTELPVDCVSTL